MKFGIAAVTVLCIGMLGGCENGKINPHTGGPWARGLLSSADYDRVVVIPDVFADEDALITAIWIALVEMNPDINILSDGDLLKVFHNTSVGERPYDRTRVPFNDRVALVQLGDLIDRGTQSIQCIRIMQKINGILGWNVRALYGNHEIMNMRGTAGHYIVEDDWEDLSWNKAARMDAMRPGGSVFKEVAGELLAMVRLEGPTSDDGINTNTLFVHGGLHKKWLSAHGFWARDLTGQAVVESVNAYYASLARNRMSLKLLQDFCPDTPEAHSPVCEGEMAELRCDAIDELLIRFNVARIIVGHSPQADHNVKAQCGGKVIFADVAMSRWALMNDRMHPTALILEMDKSSHSLQSIIPYTRDESTLGDAKRGEGLPLYQSDAHRRRSWWP